MKKFISLFIAIAIVKISMACLNESHTDKHGKTHYRDQHLLFYNQPDIKRATEFLRKYYLKDPAQYDKDTQSDIAVNLIYTGQVYDALAILKRLQAEHPDDYNIAANLGTAYELYGENELALQFIKKGMQLNPDSHSGSEWVHVKILEAKIQLAKDPDWLLTHRVLNTNVNFNSKPSDVLATKSWHVEYQLEERIPFTPFPDKILGNILDEFGDLLATQESVELAYAMYDFSLQYDPADHYGIKEKMNALRPLLIKNNIVPPGWKNYYYNRSLNRLQAEVPDSLTGESKGIIGLIEQFEGNTPKQKKERKHKQLVLYSVTAGIVFVLAGFILYRRSKKRKKQL